MRNNPKIELIMVNTYTKFDQIASFSSQDIEQKQNFDNNQEP